MWIYLLFRLFFFIFDLVCFLFIYNIIEKVKDKQYMQQMNESLTKLAIFLNCEMSLFKVWSDAEVDNCPNLIMYLRIVKFPTSFE